MATPITRRALGQAETVLLADKLRGVCTTASDGYAVYAAGWSDARVAQELEGSIDGINANHVATLRSNLIGKLRSIAAQPITQEQINGMVEQAVRARTTAATTLVNNLGDRLKGAEDTIVRLERIISRLRINLEGQANVLNKTQSQLLTLYGKLGESPDA